MERNKTTFKKRKGQVGGRVWGGGEGGLPSQATDGSITQGKFSLIPPLYITKKIIKVPD